jgi:hypothetical protein
MDVLIALTPDILKVFGVYRCKDEAKCQIYLGQASFLINT